MRRISFQRIGLLGGTFDPIHNGHIELAIAAKKIAQLDVVFFIPNYQSPFKPGLLTPIDQRLQMIELALLGYPHFLLSPIETSPKIHYTCDTIKHFQRLYPEADLIFLAGEDILQTLGQWKDFHSFISEIQFLLFPRGDKNSILPKNLINYQDQLIRGEIPLPQISSSQIRSWVTQHSRGKIPSVPKKVSDYIRNKQLYLGG